MPRTPDTFFIRPHRRSVTKVACVFAAFCILIMQGAGCGLLPGGPGSCDDPAWAPANGEEHPVVKVRNAPADPLYLVRADLDGKICKSQALDAILTAIHDKQPTDIYVICPGWTTSYAESVGWMTSFLGGAESLRLRAEPEASRNRPYRPLYIGIIWPSDVLVDAYPPPSTVGGPRPVRADTDAQALADILGTDAQPARLNRIRSALKTQGHAIRATRMDRLLSRAANLTPPDLVDLADCLRPLYGPQEEPSVPGPRFAEALGAPKIGRIRESEMVGLLEQSSAPMAPIDPLELLETWKRAVREVAADTPHEMDKPGDDASRARRGGLRVVELVRWALKATDLRLMKDRAYRVGRAGVGNLLDSIDAKRGQATVHLIGHSLGCEVLLEALSRDDVKAVTPATTAPATTAPVAHALADTVLLLQPLVSSWAFAGPQNVPADVLPSLQTFSRPGEYRPALTGAVRGSVVITRSTKDWVASYYAPKALRRPPMEGEAPADTWAGEGNGFKVLAGAGPLGIDPPPTPIPLNGVTPTNPIQRYDFTGDAGKLVVIDASVAVLTHCDVNDAPLWWILANQVSGK